MWQQHKPSTPNLEPRTPHPSQELVVGGPAHNSGTIELNDIVVSIDGQDVRGRTAADVSGLLDPVPCIPKMGPLTRNLSGDLLDPESCILLRVPSAPYPEFLLQ